MTAHRAELRRVGDGRWAVVFNGETIVAASPDPEPEACRVLYARGIKGRVIFHHPRGTVACGMEIEAAVDASCAINDAEIAEFADYACRTAPREPDPYLIGQDLVYLDREWHANREPRRIWPYGRSRAWVETFFAAKERKNERDRGRRRRKAAGATPRSESLAACARAIGKSPKTLRHRFKKAGLSWAEVRNMATEAGLALPDFVRSLIKEDSIRSRTKKGSPTTERPRRKPGGRASKTATPLTTKKAVRLGADGAGRQEPISNIGRCSTCS